jgi:hypothetical protein
MLIEKIINWICFVIVVGIASTLSLHIILAIHDGSIQTISKSGTGRLLVLADSSLGFWLAVIPHLLLNGTAWYLAYWAYSRRIRRIPT